MDEPNPIESFDDEMKKHPNRFYNIKKMVEKSAGFGEKAPETLEQKLDVYSHYAHPDNLFQEKIQRDIGAIINGGHPNHEKGAKYHSLKKMYEMFGSDEDKIEKDEDIRRILTPFIDEFLMHTHYEKFKQIEDKLKKGKADGSKYTEEDIFKYKASVMDRMIHAGQDVYGENRKRMGVAQLMENIKGKKRMEVEFALGLFSDDVISGYKQKINYAIRDAYFKETDEVGIHDYFEGKLKDRGLKPKETMVHLSYHQLLNKYDKLLRNEAHEEYAQIPQEGGG